MKKAKIWVVALLTLIVSMFAFSSCDVISGLFGGSIVGTYKMSGIRHFEVEEYATYGIGDEFGGAVLTEDMVKLELKGDNTFVLKLNNFPVYSGKTVTEEYTGTWKADEEESTDGCTYYWLEMPEGEGCFEIRIDGDFFGLRMGEGTFAELEKESFLPF